MAQPGKRGMVVLVGAGPGCPGLITLEGLRWLRRADAVFYDRLAPQGLLDEVRAGAERVNVGKSSGEGSLDQDDINRMLIAAAAAGKLAVRLKGGDPFIFGRGGEEASALAQAGVPFRVVPGITAAAGAAAWAGLPLTDRRLAGTLALVTGQEDPRRADSRVNYSALAGIDTVVFYMGVKALPDVAARLIAAGRSADTPAAVIERATLPGQRVVTGTLGTIAAAAAAQGVAAPAVVIVGAVVRLADRLDWRSALPLAGRTIVVTRAAEQAAGLADRLAELGAEVLVAPALEIRPPADWAAADAALAALDKYTWVCFTSRNGVAAFLDRAAALRLDGRALAGARLAAIGPATAAALRERFLQPDVLPQRYTGAALAEAMLAAAGASALSGRRVLLARSDVAAPELPRALRAAGAVVDDVAVYRTVAPAALAAEVTAALAARRVDWITFTSGSTVRNFLALLRAAGQAAGALSAVKAASIGPSTSAVLRAAGLAAAVEAQPHTAEGLADAILAWEGAGR